MRCVRCHCRIHPDDPTIEVKDYWVHSWCVTPSNGHRDDYDDADPYARVSRIVGADREPWA